MIKKIFGIIIVCAAIATPSHVYATSIANSFLNIGKNSSIFSTTRREVASHAKIPMQLSRIQLKSALRTGPWGNLNRNSAIKAKSLGPTVTSAMRKPLPKNFNNSSLSRNLSTRKNLGHIGLFPAQRNSALAGFKMNSSSVKSTLPNIRTAASTPSSSISR